VRRTVTKPRDQRAWRLVFSRIQEAADAVNRGAKAEEIARKFSKRVDHKDVVVWAQDRSRMTEAEFAAKYSGSTPRSSRGNGSTAKPALSLKDAAVAARNEEHRLEVLERQLEQQLEAVRREKKDIQELLAFLDRKQQPAPF
jgi:hypothetical protein